MFEVLICEDDNQQRRKMERVIENYIFIENLELKIVLSTGNPNEIIRYLRNNPNTTGLYFLDVDLGHELDGIMLGSKIREIDKWGKIVFVTTHGELAHKTFKYAVEAMDYIVKGDDGKMSERIIRCIDTALERLTDNPSPNNTFTVEISDRKMTYSHDNILFIESSDIPHKLGIHLKTGIAQYYGSLQEAEELLPKFYRSHKSTLLNPKNVLEVNKLAKTVHFDNGDVCIVSSRKLNGLLKLIG